MSNQEKPWIVGVLVLPMRRGMPSENFRVPLAEQQCGPDATTICWYVFNRRSDDTTEYLQDFLARDRAFKWARKHARSNKVAIEGYDWMTLSEHTNQFNRAPSPRGAQMGRQQCHVYDGTSKVRCFKVKMVDGDYDDGGAYWGGLHNNLYHARGGGLFMFFRAKSRAEAKRFFQGEFVSKHIHWGN